MRPPKKAEPCCRCDELERDGGRTEFGYRDVTVLKKFSLIFVINSINKERMSFFALRGLFTQHYLLKVMINCDVEVGKSEDNRKVPVTIITGQLGAGKTTLLTYILKVIQD